MKRLTDSAQPAAHGWAASVDHAVISYRRIRDSAHIVPRLLGQDDSAKCNIKWKEYKLRFSAPAAAQKEPSDNGSALFAENRSAHHVICVDPQLIQ